MTDPSADRDGSSAVAALATHLNKLSRDLKSLPAKVDALASTQQKHAVVLNGIAELRRQVEQIYAISAEEDDEPPTVWFWLTMSEQERDEKLAELSDWVETVFRAQYPDYLARSDKALLAQPPGSQMGASLVPGCASPSQQGHEPLRSRLFAASQLSLASMLVAQNPSEWSHDRGRRHQSHGVG